MQKNQPMKVRLEYAEEPAYESEPKYTEESAHESEPEVEEPGTGKTGAEEKVEPEKKAHGWRGSSEYVKSMKKNQRMKNRQKKKSRKSSIMSLIIQETVVRRNLQKNLSGGTGTGGNICSS